MKKITISLEEEAFLFYQRVAFVLESSTELVIADYLTKLSVGAVISARFSG